MSRKQKTRKTKLSLYNRRNNKSKRNLNRRRYRKGGNNQNVTCCMCKKKVNKEDTLVPLQCLNKNGKAAHRICSACWWDQENGFAREGVSHECPGCKKGLPLTHFTKEPSIYIDLTEE